MKEYLKKTIEFYDTHVAEYIKKTKNLRKVEWLTKFISYLKPKEKILDIGCAFGRDTVFFVEKGFNTYGIDLSLKMIEKARELLPEAKFFVMDILDLKFNDEFFDGIWCSATLLHISKKDILKALNEVKRVLKQNGVLFFNVKEGEGERIVKDERYEGAERFYSYFTESEIKELLDKVSFQIIDFQLAHYDDEYRRDTTFIYVIAKKIKKNIIRNFTHDRE